MSNPNPAGRWKLATFVFAAATLVLGAQTLRSKKPSYQAPSPTAGDTLQRKIARPLRVSAAAIGVSEAELIAKALHTDEPSAMHDLLGRLAMVGTDETVEALAPLLRDRRAWVAAQVATTFGKIATERAVDVLLDAASTERLEIARAVVSALGTTQNERAVQALILRAQNPKDLLQETAIAALGEAGTPPAVAVLAAMLETSDRNVSRQILWALATEPQGDLARQTLLAAIEHPDETLAAVAIGALRDIDKALATQLIARIELVGDEVAAAAINALSKAPSEVAIPALLTIAQGDRGYLASQAASTIGSFANEQSLAALQTLAQQSDEDVARTACYGLASDGSEAARIALIDVALSDARAAEFAVQALIQVGGADVDAALLTILASAKPSLQITVLQRLLKVENPVALEIASKLATGGVRENRIFAVRSMLESGSVAARAAVLTIARSQKSQARIDTLECYVSQQGLDDDVMAMVSQGAQARNVAEATAHIRLLARSSSAATVELLAQLAQHQDPKIAAAAIESLTSGHGGLGKPQRDTLMRVYQTASGEVKKSAALGLLRAGGETANKIAMDAISGSDPAFATQALGFVGRNGSSARVIEAAIASSNPQVRAAAISGALAEDDERMVGRVASLVRDSNPEVRAAALSALGNSDNPRAQQVLIDAARSGDASDRANALSRLGRLDTPAATAAIAQALTDSDPAIASTAIYATYGGNDQLDAALVGLMQNPNVDVALRSQAANQLRNNGVWLDEQAEQVATKLVGDAYGGGRYGGGPY